MKYFVFTVLFCVLTFGQQKIEPPEVKISTSENLQSQELPLLNDTTFVNIANYGSGTEIQVEKLLTIFGSRSLEQIMEKVERITCWKKDNLDQGYCFSCDQSDPKHSLELFFYKMDNESKCSVKKIEYSLKNIDAKIESGLIDEVTKIIGTDIPMTSEKNIYSWVTPFLSLTIEKSSSGNLLKIEDINIKKQLELIHKNKDFLVSQVKKVWNELESEADNYLFEISAKDFPLDTTYFQQTSKEQDMFDDYRKNKNLSPVLQFISVLSDKYEKSKSKELKACLAKKIYDIEDHKISSASLTEVNSIPNLPITFKDKDGYLVASKSFSELAREQKLGSSICYKYKEYETQVKYFLAGYSCRDQWENVNNTLKKFRSYLKSKVSIYEKQLIHMLNIGFRDSNLYFSTLKAKKSEQSEDTKKEKSDLLKPLKRAMDYYSKLGDTEKQWVEVKKNWVKMSIHPDPVYYRCQFTD